MIGPPTLHYMGLLTLPALHAQPPAKMRACVERVLHPNRHALPPNAIQTFSKLNQKIAACLPTFAFWWARCTRTQVLMQPLRANLKNMASKTTAWMITREHTIQNHATPCQTCLGLPMRGKQVRVWRTVLHPKPLRHALNPNATQRLTFSKLHQKSAACLPTFAFPQARRMSSTHCRQLLRGSRAPFPPGSHKLRCVDHDPLPMGAGRATANGSLSRGDHPPRHREAGPHRQRKVHPQDPFPRRALVCCPEVIRWYSTMPLFWARACTGSVQTIPSVVSALLATNSLASTLA